MAFEEAFDIQVPDDQVEACTAVVDALRLLDQLRNAAPSDVRG
jgi:acyl carrier protein